MPRTEEPGTGLIVKSCTRYVVGLARVYNCYGGPEEGGWYYSAGKPVERGQVFFNAKKAYAYLDDLRKAVEAHAEAFPGVGVGGCGDDDGMSRGEICGDGFEAVIQHTKLDSRKGLEPWPAVTPHYE